MKGSRFTETQIIAILKEVESGMLVKDVCARMASHLLTLNQGCGRPIITLTTANPG